MSTAGAIFTTRQGRNVRHVEKHQGISMDHWYLDSETGREFDVRELPEAYLGADHAAVHAGDREAHRQAIQRALKDNHDFRQVRT